MKKIDWQAVAAQTREIFPQVVQIAYYSRNRWIIVFEEEPENFLNTFNPLKRIIDKHKLAMPLIVNESFIMSSLDSYPLEFLDIQSDYTNLHASRDILADVKFESNDIRLQIERELKSKWLLTRLSALQHGQKTKHLHNILNESFTALIPVFKGFCYLNGTDVPKEVDDLLNHLEEMLHTELKVFRYISGQKNAPSTELIGNLFNDYLRALNLCIDKIDHWKLS